MTPCHVHFFVRFSPLRSSSVHLRCTVNKKTEKDRKELFYTCAVLVVTERVKRSCS